MRFSLVIVCRYIAADPLFLKTPGEIWGNVMQFHHGTLESAIKEAKAIEKANNNNIDVGIVESWGESVNNLVVRKRLDSQRNKIEC